VAFDGPRRIVIDEPSPKPAKLVAGYLALEVKDMAEAFEWVKRAPIQCSVRVESKSAPCSRPPISATPLTPELAQQEERLVEKTAKR
jgi:hypothetical protein